jgi:hypothetical protein
MDEERVIGRALRAGWVWMTRAAGGGAEWKLCIGLEDAESGVGADEYRPMSEEVEEEAAWRAAWARIFSSKSCPLSPNELAPRRLWALRTLP